MALREILAKFGFEFDPTKLVSAKKGIQGFAENVKTLTEKLAGGDLSTAIKDMVSDLKDQTAEIKSLARLTGQSFEDTQRWTSAAKLSGSNIAALATGFRVLQKNAAAAAGGANETAGGMIDAGDGAIEAALGSKAAREAFKALGVEVRDANGEIKPSSQLMGDAGLAIAALKSPAERSAFAMKLFGRQGTALLPMFSQGEKGLQGFLDKIDEMGGGISEEAVKAMAENSRASKEYDMAILSLKSGIVSALLPAMTAKVQVMAKVGGWFARLSRSSNILKAATIVLGAAFLYLNRQAVAAGFRTILAWAPTVIGFALLALLVDDLITAFSGGDSVIGTFGKKLLEAALGADESARMIGSAQKKIDGLSKGIEKQSSLSGKVSEGFSQVGYEIVKFFADDIPEAVGFLWDDTGAKVVRGFEMAWDRLKSSLGGAKDNFVTWAKGLGTALIDGIVNSITSGISKVTGALDSLGKGFVSKLRSLFDWHSPAGLTGDLGDDLILGLTMRLDAGSKDVKDQAGKTYSMAIPDPAMFAPVVPVPRPASSQVYAPRSVDSRHTVNVKILAQSGFAGIESATRSGINQGMGDSLDTTLDALESLGSED